MLLPHVRPWRIAFCIATGLLACLLASARGQVSFYGAPPPADFGDDAGGNEAFVENTGDEQSSGLGLGIFSRKPFKMSLAVREGYDSNVFTTRTDPDSSFYTNWAAGINYSFGSSRLRLGAALGGGITYYYTRPGNKLDYTGNFSLNATYLATPRLTLSVGTSTAYLSQPDLTIVGGTNRQNGDYLYSNTTVSAAYQWTEIISTVTSYNFTALYYLEKELNDNQGNISQTVSQSVRWLWKPKTTLVLDYRANYIAYYQADLNQFGNYFLVGWDQIFNPRFTWNFRFGAQLNLNNNPIDGSSTYIGPFGESTLSYQVGRSTSVSWNMRYGTEQSGLNDVTQRQTFRTGLYVDHAFTRRISANFGLNYQYNYYDQSGVIPTFGENIVNVSLALAFKINRFSALQAGYQFTIDIAPDAIEREYSRSVAFVGANFSF